MPSPTASSFQGQKIVIIGAGLAGTLCAIMLVQRGARVELIERQDFETGADYGNRRSFNLTISSRGAAVLEAAGLWPRIKARTIPITGRMCHDGRGIQKFPYGRDESFALHGCRRTDVNAELVAAAREYESLTLRSGYTLDGIDKRNGAVTISPVAGGASETITDADFTIGADGVYSTMRRLIHRGERADFNQHFLDWNYREVFIPAGSDPDHPWVMDPNALHIWPRGDLMMFALPNPDGSFTGNFIYPSDRETDFQVPGLMGDLFRREFADVAGLLASPEETLKATPPSYFPTQRNTKWYHGDRFVLLGDAAHATVPFYGQGMNSAFESTAELIRCLEAVEPAARAKAFATYQAKRKPNTDTIADLSMTNFEELRSNFKHVMPKARRRAEVLLSRLFPKHFVPLHVQISHSLTDYRQAVDDCARRDRMLRWCGLDLLILGFAAIDLVSRGFARLSTAPAADFSDLSSAMGETAETSFGLAPGDSMERRA